MAKFLLEITLLICCLQYSFSLAKDTHKNDALSESSIQEMENLDPLDEDELSFLQENEDIDADEEAEEEDFMNNDEVTEDEVDDRREGEAQTYEVLSDNDNEEEENEKASNKVAQTSR